jgi:hypothetical protein
MTFTRLRIALLLLLLVLVSACSKSAPGNSENREAKTPTSGSVNTAASKDKIKIKTPDEQTVVEFSDTGGEPQIEFSVNGQKQILRGKSKDSSKRKYENDASQILAEVKTDSDSFKIRTPDGKLLWKVKFNDDKIKISNNEEMASPFALKAGEQDRVKVLREETEIGKVKFYRDRGKVKIDNPNETTLFESNTNTFLAFYGLMLISEIPAMERYIIMAELLARGK